jgi:hypothetical protein
MNSESKNSDLQGTETEIKGDEANLKDNKDLVPHQIDKKLSEDQQEESKIESEHNTESTEDYIKGKLKNLRANKVDYEILNSYKKKLPDGQDGKIEDFKAYLSDYIKKSYRKVSKIICPERRRSILRESSTQGLLEICRFLYTVTSDKVLCDKNPKHFAEFLVLNDFSFICSDCLYTFNDPSYTSTYKKYDTDLDPNQKIILDDSFKYYVAIALENKIIIKNQVLDIIKQSSSLYLNKFHLKLRNLSDFPLSYLLQEGKSLKLKTEVKIKRCIYCKNLLSFGANSPVILDCNHFICFNCYLRENDTECNLCQRPMTINNDYFDLDVYAYDIKCHTKHSFINSESNDPQHNDLFKLPCLHVSCKRCVTLEVCQECKGKYSQQDVKLHEKLMMIVKHLELDCKTHAKKAMYYELIDYKEFCGDCLAENPTISPYSCKSIYFTYTHLISKLKHFMNDSKFKAKTHDNETIKRILYHKVLTLNDLNTLIRNLIIIQKNLSILPMYSIKRFSELLTGDSITKVWNQTDDEVCGFNAKFDNTILIHGIIFGGFIVSSRFKSRLGSCSNLLVTIFSRSKEKSKFLLSSRLDEEENEILFPFSNKFRAGKTYQITVKVSGRFVHGRVYTSKNIEGMHLTKLGPKFKEAGNNAIGGPILGLLVSDYKLFNYS